jgi:hypothetical protein
MGNNIDIICSTTEQGDRKADGWVHCNF